MHPCAENACRNAEASAQSVFPQQVKNLGSSAIVKVQVSGQNGAAFRWLPPVPNKVPNKVPTGSLRVLTDRAGFSIGVPDKVPEGFLIRVLTGLPIRFPMGF